MIRLLVLIQSTTNPTPDQTSLQQEDLSEISELIQEKILDKNL